MSATPSPATVPVEIRSRQGHVLFSAQVDASIPAHSRIKTALMAAIKAGDNLAGAYLADADLAYADLARANLAGANLTGAYLAGADLARANLAGANLTGAYLAGADLAYADLAGANLAGADLAGADLAGADLAGANLAGADLAGANLAGADLVGAKLPHFQIPQDGSLTVWKKASGKLVKLLIPTEARRTATLIGRKCRAEYAIVLEVEGGKPVESNLGHVIYAPGETVRSDSYDPDPRVECTHGLHFWLTREEAEEWY